jgi:uncharacterized protein YfcZ (UPF0381/DUF406 family)
LFGVLISLNEKGGIIVILVNHMLTKSKKKAQEPVGYDDTGPIFALNSNGVPVCGSRRRENPTGELCMSVARMSPSGRCRIHGGKAGRPISKGLYSNSIPSHLRETYEKSLQDPNVGSMTESIALMDALIDQYLKGLMRTPPLQTLQRVAISLESEVLPLLENCESYPESLESLLKDCVKQLTKVYNSRSEEQEIRKALRERAELVKAEAVRVDKASKYITLEQAMALVAALVTLVNKYVHSESERNHLSAAIDRLIGETASEGYKSQGESESRVKVLPPESETQAVTT